MKFHSAHGAVIGFTFAAAAVSFSSGAFGFDEEAAKKLAKNVGARLKLTSCAH